MANTFSQVYLQFIFGPKYRAGQINADWENELYKYITGIVQTNKHKMIAINGMPDHIHFLVGFHTTQSIMDLILDVKTNSSKWINNKKILPSKFEWQEGYGVFSYSKSQVTQVVKYIQNQKEHHKKKTFIQEYRTMLEKMEISFEDKYIFQELK